MNHNSNTTHTKPSTMEHIKDKASNLVHKVADKLHGHDDTTHNTTMNSSVDPVHHHNVADPRSHHRGEGLAGPHLHDQPKHSGPLHTGAALAGAAVPHENPVDRAAYKQHQDGTHPTGGLQHPAPAGPTGTTNIPTYSQNIAPTAAGVVPTAHSTEQDHQYHKRGDPLGHQDHHHHKVESGVGLPTNNNNSTMNNHGLHHANPVHSTNATTGPTNTVPAMGAPGTTTAAGTHLPGEYNAEKGPINTFGTHHPGEHNAGTHHFGDSNAEKGPTTVPTTNNVPAMGAPGTTTAAGTHLPAGHNGPTTTITTTIPGTIGTSLL